MKKVSTLAILVLMSLFAFISCTSTDETPKETDNSLLVTSMAIDAANDIDLQTGIETTTENKSSGKSSEICATISVDNAIAYPKIFIVDFGSGCTIGQFTRKGKLKITISAPIIQTGSILTIERMDYYINNMKFEGTIKYENKTTNAKVPQWTRTVLNGKFTSSNGKVFTNSGFYTVQKTAGVETPYLLTDDIHEIIEGAHTVTNEAGETFTLTVLETLVKKYSCDYLSKGKIKINGGLLNGVVDYGNNDCDNDYTFTNEKGIAFEFKM